jgi:hypothetical protein
MVPSPSSGDKIFQWLVEIDEETSRRVAEAGCRWCAGPLHRGDYARKPRGGLLALAGEAFCRRFSTDFRGPGSAADGGAQRSEGLMRAPRRQAEERDDVSARTCCYTI